MAMRRTRWEVVNPIGSSGILPYTSSAKCGINMEKSNLYGMLGAQDRAQRCMLEGRSIHRTMGGAAKDLLTQYN